MTGAAGATLRPASPADAPGMGAILSDWIDGTPWMPRLHTRAADAAFCAGLVPCATVAEAGGEVAAFLARDGAEIGALHVAGAHRRRGLGSALLAAAQGAADRLALRTFAANAPARAFYAANGFAETGGTDGDNEEGLPDIRLDWSRP